MREALAAAPVQRSMSASPQRQVFTVQCDGERHQVAITPRGVVFSDHEDQREVWDADEREQALAILSGEPARQPIGCYEIASLVRARHFIAPGTKGGARDLLARLRGKQAARKLQRRMRRSA